MDLNSSPAPGAHPITLVPILTPDRERLVEFLAAVFEWQPEPVSHELTALAVPAGPLISVRQVSHTAPSVVPFLFVSHVEETLDRVVASGGQLDRPAWTVPMAGTLARFREPSGSIIGLTNILFPGTDRPVPPPVGTHPRPPEGAVCSIEIYSADRAKTARFFADLFGWHCRETMPGYTTFNSGAGIGGVFQSHTPTTPVMAYIYTADVGAKLAQITAEGGQAEGKPIAAPGMATFGYFTAPTGVPLGLIGPLP